MLARVHTAALSGISGRRVTVECDVRPGLPAFVVVGLSDLAVREARERVRAAIVNSGFAFPASRIVVSAAPASVRKTGASFDAAIALAILIASGQVPADLVDRVAPLAELGLRGDLRPVRGTLPLAQALIAAGITGLAVPPQAQGEAAIARPARMLIVRTLRELVDALQQAPAMHVPPVPCAKTFGMSDELPDLADVRGNAAAIRAMTIAAAGGHGLLLVGPHGSGAQMLARRLPGLLPQLTWTQAVEVAQIHSAAGIRAADQAILSTEPPFRAPHHTITMSGLVGGGVGPVPGEAVLAHRGVLALLDVDEFARGSLEALRAPVRERSVTIVRGQQATTFPTAIQLVGSVAMRDDDVRQIRRVNQSRDFFDLIVRLQPLSPGDATLITSAIARTQVVAARKILAASPAPAPVGPSGLTRTMSVAHTIAALDGRATIYDRDVHEAQALTDSLALAAA